MEYYVTKPADYWIAQNAVNITLNALGDKNRIQCSVASGAVIMCFLEDVKPASQGGDPENGDGLYYGANHEPKRWPLTISPTYFNTDSHKYVYVAIPRSEAVGTQAVIVFPSQELDIYGRARLLQGDTETYEQIGSVDYFYIYINGIISTPAVNAETGREERGWELRITDWGKLETAQGRDEKMSESEWFSYSQINQVVTFLKEIAMKEGSSFRNLILNHKNLTDVATSEELSPIDSDTMVATPGYVEKFYLSKIHDDIAKGRITFEKGLEFLTTLISVDADGNKAREGFLDGLGIFMDANRGLIEADGMNVRGFMRVMELIINRLQLMESDYSFTEGDTTERVDFSNDGQRMVLTMHKEHDNDHTPFYPGDILYAKVNDLLDHGTYYTCWVRVISVDQANNTIKVAPYPALKQSGALYVPGGSNFTFLGTQIDDADYTEELQHDYALYPDGYEKIVNLTRHGNVADGLLDGDDPSSYSDKVKQSQLGRQQAWVLSTTDKRLSFFWNVDEPIVRDENYALCLGILPDLANLPSTRDKSMPSLYVNTIFYDHQHAANYPAKVVKEDRGVWVLPDSSIPQPAADYDGQQIFEPYHFRTFTNVTWRTYRDNPQYATLTDEQLRQKMMQEYKVDLEISRAWNYGALWECLVDGTTQEPTWECTDWQAIGGDTVYYCEILSSAGSRFRNGNVDTILTMSVRFGQEDIADRVKYPIRSVEWKRKTGWDDVEKTFVQTPEDRNWQPNYTDAGRLSVLILRRDMGNGWMTDYRRAAFECTVSNGEGEPLSAMRMIL